MNSTTSEQLIQLNQEMLESVCQGDWQRYQSFCHQDLTCFEAETEGHLVEGLAFHRFYFPEQPEAVGKTSIVGVTMVRPHVRWLHDSAVVLSYTRLTQRTVGGEAKTATCCETRIWEQRDGRWGVVHVHRS